MGKLEKVPAWQLTTSVNHPIASTRPGYSKASTGKPDARARRNSTHHAASSSQGRLKDAYLGGFMVGSSRETCRYRLKTEIMGSFSQI